jgi:membrane protease YdiL (CAAX protease family)
MARVSFVVLKRFAINIGWIALFVFVGGGVTLGLAKLLPNWGGDAYRLLRDVAYGLTGFIVATLVVGKLLAKESWERLGWRREGRPATGLARPFARGIGVGLAMAVLAIVLALIFDRASIAFTPDWNRWPAVVGPLVLLLLAAALNEELIFRGFPLQRLSDAIGAVPALLVLAVGFTLAHLGNDNVSPIGLVNIALAGILLGVAFFTTGGMALAWGLHFGWNAGLGLLFDAPVSGYLFRVPAVEYAPGPHAWIDGGVFGPEGGIVATLVLIAGTLFLLTRANAFSERTGVTEEVAVA